MTFRLPRLQNKKTPRERFHAGQMGLPRFELGTSSLSATRSNQLSYKPLNPLSAAASSGTGNPLVYESNR